MGPFLGLVNGSLTGSHFCGREEDGRMVWIFYGVQLFHLESHPYNLIPHERPQLQILSPRVQPKNYRKTIWHHEASNITRMGEDVLERQERRRSWEIFLLLWLLFCLRLGFLFLPLLSCLVTLICLLMWGCVAEMRGGYRATRRWAELGCIKWNS